MTRRVPNSGNLSRLRQFSHTLIFKVLISVLAMGFIGIFAIGLYFYVQDSRTIDRFLSGEIFQHTARVYARPFHIYSGQRLRPESIVARLQRAGYEPSGARSAENGFYEASGSRVTIQPSLGENTRLEFDRAGISRIVKSKSGEVSDAYLPEEL